MSQTLARIGASRANNRLEMSAALKIAPQIFRTSTGLRLITHAVWDGKHFVAYGRCFCSCARAILELMK